MSKLIKALSALYFVTDSGPKFVEARATALLDDVNADTFIASGDAVEVEQHLTEAPITPAAVEEATIEVPIADESDGASVTDENPPTPRFGKRGR